MWGSGSPQEHGERLAEEGNTAQCIYFPLARIGSFMGAYCPISQNSILLQEGKKTCLGKHGSAMSKTNSPDMKVLGLGAIHSDTINIRAANSPFQGIWPCNQMEPLSTDILLCLVCLPVLRTPFQSGMYVVITVWGSHSNFSCKAIWKCYKVYLVLKNVNALK